ncbi:protein NRT1/ PTR FAMILY 4.5 [Selaginella moellendorffii]|nr:protein NRT1/ PTR FAMILY 4.5 [Selaginella moellendorffii]|eukprot:XP_002978416.2 protein NRT1/ PTR FAMILY 4.5 [Selaginella moellendorffii]
MDKSTTFRGWKAAPYVFGTHKRKDPDLKTYAFSCFSIPGTEALQSMVYLTLALNLSTYAIFNLHYSPADGAKLLCDFSGTATLLTIAGGYLSDVYISQFTGIIIGEILGTIGSVILTISAAVPALSPPPCPLFDPSCVRPTGKQTAIFYFGLYILAVGLANIKPNAPTLGAVQFNENDPQQKKQLLSYFNWFLFSTCIGAFPAVTVISYAQEQVSAAWGFGIPAIVLAVSIFVVCMGMPYRAKERKGSPITGIAMVFVAAARKWKLKSPDSVEELHQPIEDLQHLPHTNQFLAAIRTNDEEKHSRWKLCSVTQIEEVKAVLNILPIFACTIIVSCILSQLQTFTLLQAATLERKIGKHFVMPLASLAVFPVLAILLLMPLYDQLLVPFLRKITGNDRGISHLQRVGIGLVICTLSMVVAAIVETKRLKVARENNALDNPAAVLPMNALWMAFQFLVFGIGELFTVAGLLDFFYTESPENMRAMGISLVNVSFSFGYFLSSVIVSLVNARTKPDWLPENMNRGRLHSFYWLLAAMGAINFVNYLFWSWWYRPRMEYESQLESFKSVENVA